MGEGGTARYTCHKTSQIELCCRTSGRVVILGGVVQKARNSNKVPSSLSFTQPFFSPTRHCTSPQRRFNHTTVVCWSSCEGCGGRKGDIAPHPSHTTTTSATTHHNQPWNPHPTTSWGGGGAQLQGPPVTKLHNSNCVAELLW